MRKFLLVLAVAASFAAVQVGVAYAAPCGTVTSSTTLAANCDAPLTISASGITVNLNGHAVVCNAAVNGIVVPSNVSNVQVRNGTVTNGSSNCVNGVDVAGDANQFSSLRVHNAGTQGVSVGGDSNQFTSIIADHAGNDGFISLGSLNVVRNFVAAFNNDDGIGFFVGSGNEVSISQAVGNADKGIISGSSDTTIFGNRVSDNDRGIYLSDNSTGSLVFLNSARANNIGIEINNTSSGNRVLLNTSRTNNLDMSDDNPNCDSNIWAVNFFNTRNQSCIH
jgi:parallel beta-helix repeat protein